MHAMNRSAHAFIGLRVWFTVYLREVDLLPLASWDRFTGGGSNAIL